MADTGWLDPLNGVSGTWARPQDVDLSDNRDATSSTIGHQLIADSFGGGFGMLPATPAGEYKVFTGIQVRCEAEATGGFGSQTGTLEARLSWDGGTSWTSGTLGARTRIWDNTEEYLLFTSIAADKNQQAWGRRWIKSEFTNANFRARIEVTAFTGVSPQMNVDNLQVKVFFVDAETAGAAGGIIVAEKKIVLMG